jgi:hypothetical protein
MRRRGMALVLVLMCAAIIVIFASTMVAVLSVQNRLILRNVGLVAAQQAAAAGVNQALYELALNNAWAPTGIYSQDLSTGNASFSLTFNTASSTAPWSRNNAAGASAVTGYGGRIVPPGCVHLVALGRWADTHLAQEVLVRLKPSSFDYAIQTDFIEGSSDSLQLGANPSSSITVDSWDSSTGLYPAGQAYSGANLMTNAEGNGRIELRASTAVYGDVGLGPAGKAATINPGAMGAIPPNEYLSRSIAASRTTLPSITGPGTSVTDASFSGQTATLAPGEWRNVSLANSTVTFTAGTYRVRDMSDTTPSTLSFDTTAGPIWVYVGGSFNLNNTTLQQVNNARPISPRYVSLICTANDPMTLQGGAQAYLTLYAADSVVDYRRDLYGALAAHRVVMTTGGSAGLHFDRALQTRSFSYLVRQIVPWH